MHIQPAIARSFEPNPPLNFAWLELTNRCNLNCVHCYAESSPHSGERDLLSNEQYINLLDDLHRVGCRRVQFIGGEPTLNRGLPTLIAHAYSLGFELIEVFTNLYHIDNKLIDCFAQHNVAVATSFYSYQEDVHDEITTRSGSFKFTIKNISRVLSAGIRLRAGIIVMDENRDHVDETRDFLRELGVTDIGFDRVRHIGRAVDETCCGMGELCGSCAGGIISIGPDGLVAPCTMSKGLTVGSVLEQPLEKILASQRLTDLRREIYNTAVLPRYTDIVADTVTADSCSPCGPNGGPCNPNGRGCNPGGIRYWEADSCSPCGPNGGPCYPNGRGCNPNG